MYNGSFADVIIFNWLIQVQHHKCLIILCKCTYTPYMASFEGEGVRSVIISSDGDLLLWLERVWGYNEEDPWPIPHQQNSLNWESSKMGFYVLNLGFSCLLKKNFYAKKYSIVNFEICCCLRPVVFVSWYTAYHVHWRKFFVETIRSK